ncbi:uncharacterized protein BDZ99DRAFT_567692 [Mytilinidion resinicola]|uniref:Linalool dehydratase/isomerase domain-containing protein n=1 Tax=Mytilinidion resinicola TaxID=574789 RepID=A0A6A6YYJ4_9PEZI|nr:uncharacterized protein BDZ99DRAFT_567692 [Mytilinidion resinicola]KAF2813992.1 hypothetical protein BDZ99DRAFT_567692 [Mytilinidion resinicola]
MLHLKESISVQLNGHTNGQSNGKPKSARKKYSDGKSELIPVSVGSGTHRKNVQNKTLLLWTTQAILGLSVFYQKQYVLSPKVRAAALSLVFPGAGYIASANILGGVFFLLTFISLPPALFAWFGAGGIFFPILIWALSIPGAYYATGKTVFSYGGIISLGLLVSFITYFNRLSATARTKATEKRNTRNTFITNELTSIDTLSTPAPPDADRELSLEDLRVIQYVFDQASKAHDDWSEFNVIDQFQTSAVRYQLYEMMYCLGMYIGIYTPNFHGYAASAYLNTIEKALTPKVLGFWKWETRWGKFKTDYDPVVEDNIMVTGFFLQALMLYTSVTGDHRYTKPGSLKFRLSDKKGDEFPHSIHTIDKALVRQWEANPYCFFPCEPNWIYTPCNFYGFTGQVVYDRVFGTTHSERLLPAFEESLNANFTEPDGSILPIRSELTGFTIPGLCGALTDLVNAVLCRGYLDHVARRMWAIFRHECVNFTSSGELELTGLVGADKLDPGNYRASDFAIYPHLAYVAGEYGDEKVRKAANKKSDEGFGVKTTESGAKVLDPENASLAMRTSRVRAALLRKEDWKKLIGEGPSKTALAGPILYSVPYPGVLVAKARSHDSKDLELVLYPSAASGIFKLGVSRLVPGQTYNYGAEKSVKADAAGESSVEVAVEGRTHVHLTPA